MGKLMCKEVILDLLADYLDGALGPVVLTDLERHLQACEPCVAYLQTYQKTRELAGRAAQVEMPEEMKVRLREFLLKLVFDGATERVLGVQMVSYAAAELIQLATLAIRTGADASFLSRQLSIHPSHGERLVKIFGHDYHEVCQPA